MKTLIAPILSVWLFGCCEVAATDPPTSPTASRPPTKYQLVRTGESPYPVNDRNNLSVNCGGGKGVLIAPHWVLTASHCITSKKAKAGDVKVKFTTLKRKSATIGVNKVLRHKTKDLALLRLVRPVKSEDRPSVLLLRENLVRSDGKLSIKKVSANQTWRGIPAIGGGHNLRVPKKADRQGKAGSSGSPWLIHSSSVGDVLVGITHGGGMAPQVAYAAKWIQESVSQHSDDPLFWVTKQLTLQK
ncbi:MAG: trypsin-like serine protease [Rubripirellula sp.]|nr:trypsin-like serine protease [Rubripirellula sp.]